MRDVELDLETCVERTSRPGRLTAILATSQAPLSLLVASVCSLLVRLDRRLLDEIAVVINGPNRVSGQAALQDAKQAFLEELSTLPWHGGRVPLSITRVWGKTGHAQCLEMAIPWVRSEYYLLTHDDVLLLRPDLPGLLQDGLFADRRAAIACVPPLRLGSYIRVERHGRIGLLTPHLNTCFLVCRKSIIEKLGARWTGYHVPHEFCTAEGEFAWFSFDIGAIIERRVTEADYKFLELPDDLVAHLVAASWGHRYQLSIDVWNAHIERLDEELRSLPDLRALFHRLYRESDVAAGHERREPPPAGSLSTSS